MEFTVGVEDVEERHIVPYADLSRSEYGESAASSHEHLRWKFLQNPYGRAKGIHLYRDGLMVGRLVAQPRVFLRRAVPVTAAYMVDLLIHPEHRGMVQLVKLVGALGRLREDFACVLVTPNPAGIVVWEKLVKLHARFDLGVHVVPLRPTRIAARRWWRRGAFFAPAADAAWRATATGFALLAGGQRKLRFDTEWPADAELDALLAAGSDAPLAGRRDRAFLDWRFRRSPVFRYDLTFIRKQERLVGYVATRRTVHDGYDTRFVVDAYAQREMTADDWKTVAWRLVGNELQRDGAELLMILGNTARGPLAMLARPPFVRVPEKLVPQRTPVFADWWTPAPLDFTAESLELTLADCDMF